MSSIVHVIGRLGADPETRMTPNGQKVTNLRVAASYYRSGKEETIWWRATIWGERYDKMISYMKKGSSVILVGEMHEPRLFSRGDGSQGVSCELTVEMIKFGASNAQEKTQQSPSMQNNDSFAAPSEEEEPLPF